MLRYQIYLDTFLLLLFHQVLQNILAKAFESSPADSTVTLRIKLTKELPSSNIYSERFSCGNCIISFMIALWNGFITMFIKNVTSLFCCQHQGQLWLQMCIISKKTKSKIDPLFHREESSFSVDRNNDNYSTSAVVTNPNTCKNNIVFGNGNTLTNTRLSSPLPGVNTLNQPQTPSINEIINVVEHLVVDDKSLTSRGVNKGVVRKVAIPSTTLPISSQSYISLNELRSSSNVTNQPNKQSSEIDTKSEGIKYERKKSIFAPFYNFDQNAKKNSVNEILETYNYFVIEVTDSSSFGVCPVKISYFLYVQYIRITHDILTISCF